MTPTREPHTPIAIIGAGMGGLVLARVLDLRRIPATVFERERGPHERTQGGSLDLHPDAGQRALVIAELDQPFWALARTEAGESQVLDPGGRLLAHLKPDADADVVESPEIDRPQLRSLLLDAVPADMVQWGAELVRVEARGSNDTAGGWRLFLGDGTSATCDVLVGADGGRSRIRPLCTDVLAEFRYSYVEMAITDADTSAPDVAQMVGPGSCRVLGNNLNLMAQRNGDGSIRVSVSARAGEGWPREVGVDEADPVGTKTRLRDLFATWEPRLVSLLDATDDRVIYRPIYAGPTEISWPTQPAVTLIGDAAHLMAPTGDGANHAMLDGAVLGAALADARIDGALDTTAVATAVAAYESEMFARASRVAQRSRMIEEIGVSDNAAERLAQYFGQDSA